MSKERTLIRLKDRLFHMFIASDDLYKSIRGSGLYSVMTAPDRRSRSFT